MVVVTHWKVSFTTGIDLVGYKLKMAGAEKSQQQINYN